MGVRVADLVVVLAEQRGADRERVAEPAARGVEAMRLAVELAEVGVDVGDVGGVLAGQRTNSARTTT